MLALVAAAVAQVLLVEMELMLPQCLLAETAVLVWQTVCLVLQELMQVVVVVVLAQALFMQQQELAARAEAALVQLRIQSARQHRAQLILAAVVVAARWQRVACHQAQAEAAL